MTVGKRMEATESALVRYDTYRKAFRNSAIGNIIMLLAVVISVIMAWSAWTEKQNPRYFATYQDGGIIPLVPLSYPFLDTGEVTNFAVEAVTRAFSMNFKEWNQSLNDVSRYFEQKEGWQSFLVAISDSGRLDFIQKNKLISSTTVNEAYILNHGVDENGRYGWEVKIKMETVHENETKRTIEQNTVDLVISRVHTWENPSAIGIKRIIMRGKDK